MRVCRIAWSSLAGISALLAATMTLVAASPSAGQLGGPPAGLFEPNALRVFVCGSASPLGNVRERAQACIAVIAGERMFLVDTGSGSAKNLGIARIPMQRLSGVLLTHYHSDHIGDLPAVNQSSWIAGRSESLPVLGPKGVDQVVAGFNQAYALDRSYRTAHHGEELLPEKVGPMKARVIEPGVVYEKEGLKITAFPVDHRPIVPAFGYRFDYVGRSVVVSGDTVATATLTEAAKDSDLLLHDAMALALVQQFENMMKSAGNQRTSKLLRDVQDYHAPTADLVALAKEAGVGKLALYHLVPAPANATMLSQFRAGLPEEVVVTMDGMLFELGQGVDTVEQKQLFQP